MTMHMISIAIAGSLLIGAAFGLSASPVEVSQATELVGTKWQLVKFQGSNALAPDDRSKYTFEFSPKGQVNARLDCNRGNGTWKSSGANQIRFGPLALTRAMCPPGSLQPQIAKHWTLIRSFTIKDGHLFLSLRADGGIYEFEPVMFTTSLTGKKWKLTEVNGVAVKSDRAYIEFDGKTSRFSGNGGCNRIAGSYTIEGSHIKFSEAISTKMACVDNEVQQVETDFLKGLGEVTDFQIQGDVLRLLRDNQTILTFKVEFALSPVRLCVPASSASLRWKGVEFV